MDDDYPLQTLFTHLYGALGDTVARLADCTPGERVVAIDPNDQHPRFVSQPHRSLGDDDVGPDDPLPAVEFATPLDLDTMRTADVVVAVLPTSAGPAHSDTIDLVRNLIIEDAPARAVLLAPAGLLFRTRDDLRATLLEAGPPDEIVFGRPRSGRQIHSAITWAAIRVSPGRRKSGTTQVSSLHGEYAQGFECRLDPTTPWTLTGLDPDLKSRIDRWAKRTNARPLDQLVSSTDDLKQRTTDDLLPPLRARAVTRGGLDTTEVVDEQKAKDRPTRVLRSGDVVGRTFGDDPMWCVVPSEADGRRVLSGQLHVLAPSGIAPELLVTFLNSEMATLQLGRVGIGVIPRVTAKALSELLVPDLSGLSGLDPTGGLQSLRTATTDLIEDLTEQVEGAFDLGQHDLRHSLAGAERDARLAASMIRQVRQEEYRAQQTFPHPLARAVRQLRMRRDADDDRGSYDELLRVGETSTTFLGLVMGSLLHRESFDCPEMDAWREAAGKRGVSLGQWMGLVRRGAEAARRGSIPMGGLATALRTNGPLINALDLLLEQRNSDSHGSAPRTPFEYQTRLDRLQPALSDLLAELSALTHCQFFIVDSMEYASGHGFTMTGRDLRGDHPDFMPWSLRSSQPLDTGIVHIDFGDGQPALSLEGYCSLIACSQCLREELCYPDRVVGDEIKMRSLERGHPTNAVDAAAADFLRGQ